MIKRGVSAVIANVLIVLLVVAGVAIMWGFIYPVLKDTGSDIDITQFSLFLEILPNSVDYNSTLTEINFTVYRKAGSGELAGIVILLEDSGGTQARIENIEEKYALEELESVIFDYNYTDSDSVTTILSDIRKISVAPIIVKSDGDEEVSGVTDVVLLGDNGVRTYVCGDGIIEGNEVCDGGDLDEQTCESQGCDPAGDLACYPPGSASECQFNLTGCNNCETTSVCIFTDAYWADSAGNVFEDLGEVDVGTNVNITLETVGCTVGETVRFELRESDGGDGDFILSFGDKFVDSTESISFDWTTIWTEDDDVVWPGDVNPEYKFNAILSSDTSTNNLSDRIKIMSVCGNNVIEEGIEECDGTDSEMCTSGQTCLNDCTCSETDSDGDGVPDGEDICDGYDDNLDDDGDGTPDGCDICEGYDDNLDDDGDGTPDGCDCSISDFIKWTASGTTNEITSVVDGTTVDLWAIPGGVLVCTDDITIKIYEDDLLYDDLVFETTLSLGTNFVTSWQAHWTYGGDDDMGEDPRDYYFIASYPGEGAEQSGYLAVSQGDPACGDGDDACSVGETQSCEPGGGYAGEQDCLPDCTGWGSCVPTEECGDGFCNGDEDSDSCLDDCPVGVVCGDDTTSPPSEECEWDDMCCDSVEGDEGGSCTWEPGVIAEMDGSFVELNPDICLDPLPTEYYTLLSLDGDENGEYDLVSWFRFEGNDNERRQNDGESGQNIVTESGVTYMPTSGKYGGAYESNGDSSPNSEGLGFAETGLPTGTDPRTFAAWVKFNEDCSGNTGSDDRETIISYGSFSNGDLDRNQGFSIGRQFDGSIVVGRTQGFYTELENSGDLCDTSDWIHVVVTYDLSNGFKGYVNGASDGVCWNVILGETNTADCAAVSSPSYPMDTTHQDGARIGARFNKDRDFNGLIDEVIVFSRVLNDEEVESLYNAKVNPFREYYATCYAGCNVKGYLVESSARRPPDEETLEA